ETMALPSFISSIDQLRQSPTHIPGERDTAAIRLSRGVPCSVISPPRATAAVRSIHRAPLATRPQPPNDLSSAAASRGLDVRCNEMFGVMAEPPVCETIG